MGGALGAFLAIPEALALGLIVTGTGRKLCRRLLPDASPAECSVFGFPAGMALLSLFVTALLFARVPPAALPWTLGSVLLAAAVGSRRDAAELMRELRDFAHHSPGLAALVTASALFGMIGCLAPETGFDTGAYHFALAKLRAEQGAMVVRMDVLHSFHPASLESLHAAGFALNGEALASLINESYYFAGLALARAWGLRLAGARAGTFAALAWLTSVTYVLRMDGGDVEVAQAVYLTVALLSLLRRRDGGAAGWAILAGGAVGMLAGLKYLSLVVIAVLAVVWAGVRLRDRSPFRTFIADGVVIGGVALLVCFPWYLRNKIATGSLFYPYPFHPAGSATAPDGPGPGGSAAVVFSLLRSLAMDGFAVLAIPALLLPAVSRDRWCAIFPVFLTIGLMATMAWSEASVSNTMRYVSPTWVPLFVFGAVGVDWAVGRSRGGGWLATAVLIGAVALGQGVLAKRNIPKIRVALGLVSRDAYLERRVSTYRAIREAEAGLPAGKKILLVEERGYYCRAPYLAANDHQVLVTFREISSAADFRRFLAAESIGAIVVDRGPTGKTWNFRAMERRLGTDWPPPGVRAVTIPGDASLYRVD